MICTQTYILTRFHIVAVPESYQTEWKSPCFGFAKKSYARFAALERLLTVTADSCGLIRLEPSNDDAFLDVDGATWQRLAFQIIFGADLRATLATLTESDWIYVLCETAGDGLNLYAGSKIASISLNDSNETVLRFIPKLSRVENGQRIYLFEEVA